MSLSWIIRPADRPSLRRDRSAEAPSPLTTSPVAAEPALPRHLLVSLAGITADITSLQPRCADTPQLQAALGAVLDRLDDLVDSVYERAAEPAVASLHRSSLAAASTSDALADALPAHPSSHIIIGHERRQS